MSIQDDFQSAGIEYARRLDEQHERERLAALAVEARRASNAQAFAEAIQAATTPDSQETDQ